MSQTVRVGETEDVVFTLTRNSAAFNLTGITSATLRRQANTGVEDSTDNLTGLLSVTDATAGEITLTPITTWWADEVDHYDVYMDVVKSTKLYTFSRTTQERFLVVDKFS